MADLWDGLFRNPYSRGIYTFGYVLMPFFLLLGGTVTYWGLNGKGDSWFTAVEGLATFAIAIGVWRMTERRLETSVLIYVLAVWSCIGGLLFLLWLVSERLGLNFLLLPALAYGFALWIFTRLCKRQGACNE